MNIFEQLRLLHPGWRDLVEVAIVSVAIYRVLLLIHRTRAMQVLAQVLEDGRRRRDVVHDLHVTIQHEADGSGICRGQS